MLLIAKMNHNEISIIVKKANDKLKGGWEGKKMSEGKKRDVFMTEKVSPLL